MSRPRATSLSVIATTLCAALYALGAYSTAYIPSPWGFGQFRPAVVIPAFFATIFGPMPAGVGAAIGTLIADSVKHLRLYEGSLIAAVPGNFLGFYLFGWLIRRRFSWGRFVLATNASLALGNIVVAFLYVFVYKVLYAGALRLPLEALIFLSLGLTVWWFVTMLPFVLLITPILIKAAASAVPSVVPESIRTHSLREELPKALFGSSLLVPGVAMLFVGLATTYTPLGTYIHEFFGPMTFTLVQFMFYLSGFALSILGVLVYVSQRIVGQRSPPR